MAPWRPKGHVFTDEEIKQLLESKTNEAWLRKSDIPAFRKWWLESGKQILEAKKAINQRPSALTSAEPPAPFEETPKSSGWSTNWDAPWEPMQAPDQLDLSIVEKVAKLFPGAPLPEPLVPRDPPAAAAPAPQSEPAAPTLEPEPPKQATPAEPPESRTQAYDWSHLWTQILSDQSKTELSRELRLKLSRESAETLIRFSLSAVTPEHQAAAESLMVDSMTYFIHESLREVAPGLEKLWNRLSSLCPNAHSLRVGSWAALLALLNGKLHRPLLADLLLAGLSHDVGLSQLAARTVLTPMRIHSPSELQDYSKHVEYSGALLQAQISPSLKPVAQRAGQLILQHHEKFDGRGYPKQLRGFHVEESAQFLCMADLLMTVSEGRWDGLIRTHRESLSLLERYESAGNFPEFFHPSLFQTLQRLSPQDIDSETGQKPGGKAA